MHMKIKRNNKTDARPGEKGARSFRRSFGKFALSVFAAVVVALFGAAPALAATTDDTDLQAPLHEKTATPNDDGTYKITLNVTGNSVQSSTQTQADVIVVMDLSGSMNWDQYGNEPGSRRYTGSSRLKVAKDAVNSLAEQLLGNNSTDNPDAVRLRLVTFSDIATADSGFTNSLSTFENEVNNLSANGGTNWEDALKVANSIETRDAKQTYVIFVSDGDPTYRDTYGTWYEKYIYGNYYSSEFYENYSNGVTYYGSGNSDHSGLDYKYASNKAKEITSAKKTLFSVGVFGDANKMQQLASDAEQRGNYYSADDSDALNTAFSNIANTITTNVSYTNVKIEDTLNTEYVNYVLPANAKAPEFTYSYTKNGVSYTPTTTIPAATFAGGKVTWDLGDIQLEKGVTYSVSFNVELKQKAYDDAANADGDFTINTNGTGTLSYKKITSVTDQKPTYSDEKTVDYVNPTVVVPKSTLHVTKKWMNGTAPDSLVVNVLQKDGNSYKSYKSVTLNADNNWTADVKVAAGPNGHTYKVTENASDEWDQTLPQPVQLQGLKEMTGDQVITNKYKSGTLTLTKKIKGSAANTSDSFKFELSCPELKNKSFTSTSTRTSGEQTITFDGEGKTTVELHNDETVTLNNVPAGKTIDITETTKTPNANTTTTAKVGDRSTTFDKDAAKTVPATVLNGETTAVVYTNQIDAVTDTGISLSFGPQVALLGVAMAGVLGLVIYSVRKNHGREE